MVWVCCCEAPMLALVPRLAPVFGCCAGRQEPEAGPSVWFGCAVVRRQCWLWCLVLLQCLAAVQGGKTQKQDPAYGADVLL